MPFCHKCGYKLDPDDKFCFECGTPVRTAKSKQDNDSDVKISANKPKQYSKEEQQPVHFARQETVEKTTSSVENDFNEDVIDSSRPEKQSKINRTPLIITLVIIGVILNACLLFAIGMASGKRESTDNKTVNGSDLDREAGGNNNWFLKPSPTPSPSPTPKPEIKKNKYQLNSTNWGQWVLEYPSVTIFDKDTSSVNYIMKTDIEKYRYDGKAENSKPYNSKFTYYIDDDVLSILVEIKHKNEYLNYIAYNISLKTGNLMSDSEVVKKAGLKDKDFFFVVKKTYNKFEAGISWVNQPIKDRCLKANLERISFQYVKPYFNTRGDLCFVGYVDHAGKLKQGNLCFNASNCFCDSEIEY